MKNKVPKLRFPEFSGEWEEKTILDSKIEVIDGDRGSNYPNANEFSLKGYCLFLNAKNVTKSGFNFKENNFISKERDCLLRKGKLQKGDLVLTTRGTVGNIAHFNSKINIEHLRINSGMVILRNENSKLCSNYIYYYFLSSKMEKVITKISFGSAQPQLTVKEINNFKITFPSLEEQEKIASLLSKVDESIEILEEEKELWEKYKKGMMQKIFSQKLRFKDENGNDYPEWEEKKLGEIGEFSKGKGISKSDISKEGIECIRYGQLYTTYKEKITNIISKTNISISNLIFSEVNDILIPSSGETAIDLATASCLMRNGIAIGGDINIIKTKANGIFLSYYLNNKKKQEIADMAQGISVMHLYSSQLKTLKLFIPSLPEQEKIANFLSSIDEKIELIEKELEGVKEFKKGLLQQMFV